MLERFIYERFGSKNGMMRSVGYWFFSKLGGYRTLYRERPKISQRLVFICNGNICRSPLAERYAQSLGRKAASCGLECGAGFPADPRAREFARSYDLNLEGHRTVNVREFEFRIDDFIVVMEPSHLASFRSIVSGPHQLVLAGNYLKHPHPYIHDPYNCHQEFFIRCEEKVLQAVRGICE